MISYQPLFDTLKRKKISKYYVTRKENINPSTWTRIKNNESVTLRTIESFCRCLDCSVSDIVVIH